MIVFTQTVKLCLILTLAFLSSYDAFTSPLMPRQKLPKNPSETTGGKAQKIMKLAPANGLVSRYDTRRQRTGFLNAMPDAFSNQAVPMKIQFVLVLSSIFLLAAYHVNLIIKEKSSTTTWRQYQANTREEWARHVRETEGWLYAVQTLRNAITAQSFLATTVLSLLTLITGKLWDVIRAIHGSLWERRIYVIQLLSVALTMLSSAYYFLQGVRLMTHAGFMFPVSKGKEVDRIMRKSENCQWLGLRWMYIALGPITWSIGGSRAFFVTTCILLQFFRKIDRNVLRFDGKKEKSDILIKS